MNKVNSKTLHEFLKAMDKKNKEQVEELFFNLWAFHKMKNGNVELQLDDVKKLKEILLEAYTIDNRDLIDWCILVSEYLEKYHQHMDVLELFDKALEDAQKRYFAEKNDVSKIYYAKVLYYLAEFYNNKEQTDSMFALAYYSRAYEVLFEVDEITEKHIDWFQEISRKIDVLISETELVEQKMYVQILNEKNNYKKNSDISALADLLDNNIGGISNAT